MDAIQKVTGNFNEIVRPRNLFGEVKKIIFLIFPEFNYDFILNSYNDITKLFNGEYIGYQRCDTKYHDLSHTKDCLLEMARLIHGAFLNKHSFCEKDVKLGLISAIMHDTGYIKTINDRTGTGGKYTKVHIARSIKFMSKYLAQREINSAYIQFCTNCIKCTGLLIQMNTIEFISPENELMGKILGTADLIGQMADPFYLKKLPNLFKEFQEAGIKMYDNEFDLLEKTPGFWEFTKDRFETELDNVDRYLRDHFRVRWGIDRDLDREAIEKNIVNLKSIIKNHRTDYHRFLRSQGYGAVSEGNSLAP